MASSTSQPQTASSAASAAATSTTSSPQDSPLLNLSAELRNQIYNLVLVEDTAIEAHGGSLGRPGLLQTCKQIEAEASQLFFASNRFMFHLTGMAFQNFEYALEWCPAAVHMSSLVIALDVEKEVAGCEVRERLCGKGGLVYLDNRIKGGTRLLRKWRQAATFLRAHGLDPSEIGLCQTSDPDATEDVEAPAERWKQYRAKSIYYRKWKQVMEEAGFTKYA